MYIQSEFVDKGGCFSDPRYEKEVVGQQLGVLSGELKFNLNDGGIILPTNKYAQKGEEPFFSEVRGNP